MVVSPHLEVIYKEVDDIEISTDIYLPKAKEGPHPVIIDIHGGGFILGYSGMVNKDQIEDCLDRGWIVVVPNHRLCPQVNLLEGPMQDIRDLLGWVYNDNLQRAIDSKFGDANAPQCDLDRVMSFGTSAGGHLTLALCWDVERPPAAILDFYGPCSLGDPSLSQPIESLAASLPKLDHAFINTVYDEKPIPTRSRITLEGMGRGPDFSNPRDAFALSKIASGQVFDTIWPSKDWKKVDPILNVSSKFPPTCIVHGDADTMVSIKLSRDLFAEMKKKGIEVEMIEVPGEEHTFCGKMTKGSDVWNLQKKGFDFLEKVISR